ncbi:DUF262 domain-containing protein [Polynucleobacter sp. AP-RePozz3-80-G7]|uniref:DUF262 domain-containing protein n=1 Tax=Polynucleobacter sp. AP-RePozz3-80-G7 TaxID=2689105 RepID=UPI001C0B5AC1|nr:DUF262 domain-containing protein [Polynucleobacter sp. AP-RePozz3-80-G7]MBU3639642.1 DUF262 domain-containing protein [Polynucleobacter sp. AP-RePozz3-80-G7]
MSKKDDFESNFSESYAPTRQPPADIVVFNELRSCADLLRMHEKGHLNIRPFFQRENVWTGSEQTRFIDSLVKQLPIPSMCIAFDYNTRKWIVIDGLQRMTAIIRFLDGSKSWTLSKLEDVDPNLSGALSSELHDESSQLHTYIERVENLTLPITVLRCNFDDESHMEYLFKIFHRLNSGGVKLNNQEIRNCIYSGNLNEKLIAIEKQADWRGIYRFINGKKDRFRAVELILRIMAFSESRESYGGNLAAFLNDFMYKNRNAEKSKLDAFEANLIKVSQIIVNKVIPIMENKKLGFTQLEALAVGILSNISTVEKFDANQLLECVKSFEGIELLHGKALSESTSRVDKVKGRIVSSITAFAH